MKKQACNFGEKKFRALIEGINGSAFTHIDLERTTEDLDEIWEALADFKKLSSKQRISIIDEFRDERDLFDNFDQSDVAWIVCRLMDDSELDFAQSNASTAQRWTTEKGR